MSSILQDSPTRHDVCVLLNMQDNEAFEDTQVMVGFVLKVESVPLILASCTYLAQAV